MAPMTKSCVPGLHVVEAPADQPPAQTSSVGEKYDPRRQRWLFPHHPQNASLVHSSQESYLHSLRQRAPSQSHMGERMSLTRGHALLVPSCTSPGTHVSLQNTQWGSSRQEAHRVCTEHAPVMDVMETHSRPSEEMYPASHFQVQSGLESSQVECSGRKAPSRYSAHERHAAPMYEARHAQRHPLLSQERRPRSEDKGAE
mmetsp:Transcript_42437/g.100911  ORF Transcript_42437/g.100911 Transcript_42437/m.100911 type:complete len:200 (+) Transcript_42437:801-1400(+)